MNDVLQCTLYFLHQLNKECPDIYVCLHCVNMLRFLIDEMDVCFDDHNSFFVNAKKQSHKNKTANHFFFIVFLSFILRYDNLRKKDG